jgi:hypothetical protein
MADSLTTRRYGLATSSPQMSQFANATTSAVRVVTFDDLSDSENGLLQCLPDEADVLPLLICVGVRRRRSRRDASS